MLSKIGFAMAFSSSLEIALFRAPLLSEYLSNIFANLELLAAMDPCPCGYARDPEKVCTCSHQTVTRYQKRISGPMLDRIDIHIEVPRVNFEKLSDSRRGEALEEISRSGGGGKT